MTTAKIDVLMAGPQAPWLEDAVAQHYTVHKLWLAADRAAFVAERADCIRGIVTNAPVGAGAALIDALPRLEIISSSGVGLDAIDLAAARRRGIVVATTQNVLNECVADTGLMLLLAVARRLGEAERFVRAGRWANERFPLGTSLAGKTCGILGLGNIGRGVAKRAAAFGLRVLYHDPLAQPELGYERREDPIALARDADFLVLTLPGGAGTRHLAGAELFEALGPNGFLINISRGSVLDTAALVDALAARRIAGAALDVFEDEPRVPPELCAFENVVLTPHFASGTRETRQAMSELTFANLHAHFTGRPVPTPVRD